MSSRRLYRNPAWSGVVPGLPETVRAADELALQVQRTIGRPGRLFALAYHGQTCGHFRFEPVEGPPLFVKIAGESRRESLERAEGVAQWLDARAVPVIAACDGFPRRMADGQWLFASPFLAGVRLEPTEEDLRTLGLRLARLHSALAAHPDRAAWKRATRLRLENLLDIRRSLADGRLKSGPEPERLRALARDARLDFVGAAASATPLHGDLNPGNLLKSAATGRPVFLDFEDTFHSVLPAAFELGLVVERLILVRVEDQPRAVRLAQAFLDSYRAEGGSTDPETAANLADVLQSLALRQLCVLVDCERSGVPIAASEWRKFFDLADLTEMRREALDSLR